MSGQVQMMTDRKLRALLRTAFLEGTVFGATALQTSQDVETQVEAAVQKLLLELSLEPDPGQVVHIRGLN